MKINKLNHLDEIKTIVLYLDNYNDLFSDFDPRPYSVRTISDDFLLELKRVDPELIYNNYHILFVIPKNKRIIKEENIIKKRLIEFFNNEHILHNNSKKKIIQLGGVFIALGVLVIFLFFYILPKYPHVMDSFSFFQIIFELVGWFLLWEGLNQIIFVSKEKKNHIKLYSRLSKAKITFVDNKNNEVEE